MDVIFGLYVDGGGFPLHGGVGAGALGGPVVGPQGLIELFETVLGLGVPRVSPVVRLASYQAKLERSRSSSRFWSASFDVDPWATARTLLRWRDELVDAGWRGEGAWDASRLADLAAIEGEAGDLPKGMADRIAAVAKALEAGPALPFDRIRLIDARGDLPPGWHRLIALAEKNGVEIEAIVAAPGAAEDTALGKLQRWLVHGGEVSGSADGSFIIARGNSAVLAAEVVGQWFASRGGEQSLLVAQDGDTHLLDGNLSLAGQPRAGRSRASGHRGSLQLLLLAFRSIWAPFDAAALMELLIFPSSPVAPRAARHLASALEEAPGRGGAQWTEAWKAIEQAERDNAEGDAEELKKADARMARWREWTALETVDPDDGVPLAQAIAICDRTIRWANRRFGIDEQPLYLATARLAEEVRGALIALGRDNIPRTLVERIIDQTLDAGEANPLAEAQAGSWHSVAHPGAIWAPSPEILWWNFSSTSETIGHQPWTRAEREELSARNVLLAESARAGRAASAAWERAVLHARDSLILVSAGLDASADENVHPLLHRLAPAIGALATVVELDEAIAADELSLGRTRISRLRIEQRAMVAARPVWSTPARYAEASAQHIYSATSFETLLSCPLQWALKHVAHLRAGRVRSIPDARRLLGNLAHALARDIFQPGAPPDPAAAARTARDRLDARIDELAAPLRHPELATQLAEARERLPAALAALARTLQENELVVDAAEMQISRDFEEALSVRGAIDLVARDGEGRPVIIDLKWTRSAKSRVAELANGSAIQLATYGAVLEGGAPYRAGYFLLSQNQFATLANAGLIGRQVEGMREFPAVWDAIVADWRRYSSAAASGQLVARGVSGHEAYLPSGLEVEREVHCEWCDYATICRQRGLV